MFLYIGHEASKLWNRFCAETTVEFNLLLDNWKYLLAGIFFQECHFYSILRKFLVSRDLLNAVYLFSSKVKTSVNYLSGKYIHGIAARGVHYFHRPGPILQDVGFYLLPELGLDKAYISETVFNSIFVSFFLWTFHPFIFKNKKIYTVLIWCRVLAFLVGCQILRIPTFYSTQLPGPNYHCRMGSDLATLPPPKNALEVFIIIPQGILYGCGDLIFSSHMIFSLVFVHTYHKYGTRRFIKYCAWLTAVIQSLLIVASRKHYTVDVIVAWYTVNLMIFFLDHTLPELSDRTGAAAFLLPVNKDNKDKEENQKLLNGSSGESLDRRSRNPVNDKIVEDGNTRHDDTGMNDDK